jgi:pimeloyl-ACP methyl ester carboxylesterase
LGYEKIYLAGHDWGAIVAWNIALHFPERLKKLIIMNVPHPTVMGKFIKEYRPQRRKSWYIMFFQIPLIPEMLLRMCNWKFLVSQMSKNLPSTTIDKYRAAWSQKRAITSMINWYRAGTKNSQLQWKTARVSVPTLMIWGSNDKYLDAKMAKPSIDYCDDGTLKVLEKSSHWVHQDKSNEVNSLLLEFLLKHQPDQ